MDEIRLVAPSAEYAAQVMDYREEMLTNGDSLDGCGGLEQVTDFNHWMDFEGRLRARHGAGYVPSSIYLAVRVRDHRLVGIMDFRHPLSDFLRLYGGHIGYSVRPTERRKGYAGEMLRQLLPICRAAGEECVLLTCDPENEASRKTILKNGGVMENEIADPVGISRSGKIQRYWISITE